MNRPPYWYHELFHELILLPGCCFDPVLPCWDQTVTATGIDPDTIYTLWPVA